MWYIVIKNIKCRLKIKRLVYKNLHKNGVLIKRCVKDENVRIGSATCTAECGYFLDTNDIDNPNMVECGYFDKNYLARDLKYLIHSDLYKPLVLWNYKKK